MPWRSPCSMRAARSALPRGPIHADFRAIRRQTPVLRGRWACHPECPRRSDGQSLFVSSGSAMLCSLGRRDQERAPPALPTASRDAGEFPGDPLPACAYSGRFRPILAARPHPLGSPSHPPPPASIKGCGAWPAMMPCRCGLPGWPANALPMRIAEREGRKCSWIGEAQRVVFAVAGAIRCVCAAPPDSLSLHYNHNCIRKKCNY